MNMITISSTEPIKNVKQVIVIPSKPRRSDPYLEMMLYNPKVNADEIDSVSPRGFVKWVGLTIISNPIKETTTEIKLARPRRSFKIKFEKINAKTGLEQKTTATVDALSYVIAN